ncbi:tetratricopeptide repeat protein [Streptomyces sp. NPDC002952]|uniref:tetratricopeptide repeat protein n=1 Tax=Streptomyces sp. NPDC002952 TaxID=3364673 RepID=UPI0036AB1764
MNSDTAARSDRSIRYRMVGELLTTAYQTVEAGDFAAARAALERATPLARGLGAQSLAQVRLAEAVVVQASGDWDGAAAILSQVLVDARSRRCPGSVSFQLSVRVRLGGLLLLQGHVSTAEKVLTEALAAYELLPFTAPNDIARVCLELAFLGRRTGKWGQAAAFLDRAHALLRTAHGPDAPAMAPVWRERSRLKAGLGDAGAAESAARKALDIRLTALGAGHLTVATDRSVLAAALVRLGRLGDAEEQLHRALSTFRKALGPTHAEVAVTLHNLGGIALHQGHDRSAERFLSEALMIKQKAHGGTHPDVADLLEQLAVIQRKRGEDEAAAALVARARRIRSGVRSAARKTRVPSF